jgi:hypothetical protein
MKTTTCQLVLGGVITGHVHYIGNTTPLWPLCGRHQIRACERTTAEFLPTSNAANCPHCSEVTTSTPLVYDHTLTRVGIS